MATNGRPVQSGDTTGDDTSTHYTNTTGDYSDPDIREDPDMHGMRYDYDGVMRRQRMMSRATKTGASWEGSSPLRPPSSPYSGGSTQTTT